MKRFKEAHNDPEVRGHGGAHQLLRACPPLRREGLHTAWWRDSYVWQVMRLALREVRLLKVAQHPNVVKMLEAFRSKSGRVYIAMVRRGARSASTGPEALLPHMHRACISAASAARTNVAQEFVDRTLTQEMRRWHGKGFPPLLAKVITWQLLQATAFLHARKVRGVTSVGQQRKSSFAQPHPATPTHTAAEPSHLRARPQVMHRDFKPANILLTKDYEVRVCDFGFARQLHPREVAEYTTYVVTRWYRAPEILVSDSYGPKVDVWAIGELPSLPLPPHSSPGRATAAAAAATANPGLVVPRTLTHPRPHCTYTQTQGACCAR